MLYDCACLQSSDEFNEIECDLIAISRGSTWNVDVNESDWLLDPLPELEYINYRYGIKTYQWYNVMCIGWEDGIAYRLGLGRVYKPIWEAQKLETKKILLG